MSHELRTPLNAILGFAELLYRNPTLSEYHPELQQIYRSGEHLLDLINDVLDLAKIEAGHTSLHATTFSLEELLNHLEYTFSLKAETKGIHFEVVRSPDLPPFIHADQRKLRQVLINLLGNAIKFTPVGEVVLTVSQRPHGPHSGASEGDLDWLQFDVKDTGPGISAADQRHLFQAFYQTQVGKDSQTGTGLGLRISEHFVSLMGGTLHVTSQVGEGTCFGFAIPVQIANAAIEPAVLPRQAIAIAPNQPPYRLLIADDRQSNRLLLRQLLRDLGFEVKTADNGQVAVDICANWQPHLIWMDLRMPGLDGYAATRQIKAQRRGQAPVIIALTASVFESEKSLVLDAGCDDFVRKPFQKSEIVEKLEHYLGVKFVYEAVSPHPSPPIALASSPATPDLAGWKELAPAWRDAFYHSATQADQAKLLDLLEQLPAEQTPLRQTLYRWIIDFNYDKIMSLIDG